MLRMNHDRKESRVRIYCLYVESGEELLLVLDEYPLTLDGGLLLCVLCYDQDIVFVSVVANNWA